MAYFGAHIPESNVFEPTGDCIQKVLTRGEELRDEWEEFLQKLNDYKEYMHVLKSRNSFTDEELFKYDEKKRKTPTNINDFRRYFALTGDFK